MKQHYKIVIVGGGTAGITVAARLLRQQHNLKGDIAIVEPSDTHYYQPLWTLVGAGASKLKSSKKRMSSVIPKGAQWIKQSVARFNPDHNNIALSNEATIDYDYLVVCPGLQINWSQIKGLQENIGRNGVCSNYSPKYVTETWHQIANFKGGNAIFTHPNTPIKCGGAPMKIMYLAEDYFRKHNMRSTAHISYETPKDVMFDVPKYDKELRRIAQERAIDVNYYYNLIEIDGDNKQAVFENVETGDTKTLDYEMLHVTPPMGPLDFVKESALTDNDGWVDINPTTLQHTSYKNVFALGDASNAPTSKTGAAIRKQAPVVVNNLLQAMNGEILLNHYNGYTSCPLVTGYNKLILAEFDYNKKPTETMPFNQSKERRSMYIFKKDLLPKMYWHAMLKGLM